MRHPLDACLEMFTHRFRRDDGFTLVELLVACIIIGILAAIAIPMFLKQRDKASDAKARSDLRNIANFEEAYVVDNATYASAAQLAGLPDRVPLSDQDSVYVYTAADTGYCLVGHSAGSSAYLVFDSRGGGLQQTSQPSLASAQQVCANGGYTAVGALVDNGSGVIVS